MPSASSAASRWAEPRPSATTSSAPRSPRNAPSWRSARAQATGPPASPVGHGGGGRPPAVRRVLVLLALAATLAACGGSSQAAGRPTVTIALDFVPNAVHAPIYEAVSQGFDRAHGIRL